MKQILLVNLIVINSCNRNKLLLMRQTSTIPPTYLMVPLRKTLHFDLPDGKYNACIVFSFT